MTKTAKKYLRLRYMTPKNPPNRAYVNSDIRSTHRPVHWNRPDCDAVYKGDTKDR